MRMWRKLEGFAEDYGQALFWGLLIILSGVAIVAIFYWDRPAIEISNKETLCTREKPLRATLILVDTSDPFVVSSAGRLMTTVRDEAESLSKGSRLVVASFSGGPELRFGKLFDKCSPGRAHEVPGHEVGPIAQERRWRRKFMEPLQNKLTDFVKVKRKNSSSYISDSISAAVRNSGLHFQGCERRLMVITDGLENTATSRVYRDGKIHLPAPQYGLLAGIDVVFVEFSPSETGVGLQSPQGRAAWQRWATEAGANSVDIQAPGVPPVSPPPSKCKGPTRD